MIREYGRTMEAVPSVVPDYVKDTLGNHYRDFRSRNPGLGLPEEPEFRSLFGWYVAVDDGEPEPNVGE